MKTSNFTRKLSITAFLILGILVFGTGTQVFADDGGGGTIGSGTRDGGMLGSGTRSAGGYLGSGNRTDDTDLVEEEEESFLDVVYDFIF